MTLVNPKDSENWQPIKKDVYRKYLIWRNMPPILKDPKLWEDSIEDDELRTLFSCKTKFEFAQAFGIDKDTPTDWDKRPVAEGFEGIGYKDWAKLLTPIVMSVLLRNILTGELKGDAARIGLWLKSAEDLVEKHEVNAGKELLETMRAIAEKNAHGET